MKIKMGKYTIKSDSMNIWIEEERESKRKDGTMGTTMVKVGGYCRTIDDTLKSFMHYKVRDSEANSIREFLADIKQMELDVEMMIDKLKEE